MTTPALFDKSSTDSRISSSIGAIPEAAPLNTDEADLVVSLPRHVVGRSNVDVPRVEPFVELRLNGFGLGDFFRLRGDFAPAC